MGKVRLEAVKGSNSSYCWGMKDEEYMADFCLVSRRALDPAEYQLFRYHFLLGADWKLCCRRLKMDRGSFFHHVYRIEQKLGKVYRELRPFALFPLDEYFGGTVRKALPSEYSALKLDELESGLEGMLETSPYIGGGSSRGPATDNVVEMPLRRIGKPLRAPIRKVA